MPLSNKRDNFGIIIKDFYGVPCQNEIQLTTYEIMMFEIYIWWFEAAPVKKNWLQFTICKTNIWFFKIL